MFYRKNIEDTFEENADFKKYKINVYSSKIGIKDENT